MEETTIESLQTEVEFYRQNQTAVETEVRTLIEDNRKLSQQVAALLKERLDNARKGQDRDADRELEECRKQVMLVTKERDSLHVLWETSQKTIYALETELKAYQEYDGRGNNVANRKDLENKLQTSLSDYLEIETKYKELQTKINATQNDNKAKEKEINTYKERGKELETKIGEISKVVEEYRINLAVEKKNNEDLKNQLQFYQKENVNLVKKEAEAKTKVSEALQLYDVVAAQKNEAYRTIADTTEELTILKQTLANVKRDTENEFKKEIEEAKESYNEKVADMLAHIRNLDSELVEKGLLLNKALREIKVLNAANESFMKKQNDSLRSIDPKLALAEQRIEAMFQELVTSERRNIQLSCEKQSIAMELQRAMDMHGRESKRRQWEEGLLRAEGAELRVQVEHLQKSLEETHGMVNKLQTILASRTELNQKMVSTKEEELVELNKHLENQMQLNKKWKESYVEMTEKLKKRMNSLQKENEHLRHLTLPTSETNIQSESESS